jgi:hypothetical protein
MNMDDNLKMLEDSLVDLSTGEIKVLGAVCLSQREKEAKRAGLVKLWSALFCLLNGEFKRRIKAAEAMELDFYDMQEPAVEWTGQKDPDPGQAINLKIKLPEEGLQ